MINLFLTVIQQLLTKNENSEFKNCLKNLDKIIKSYFPAKIDCNHKKHELYVRWVHTCYLLQTPQTDGVCVKLSKLYYQVTIVLASLQHNTDVDSSQVL